MKKMLSLVLISLFVLNGYTQKPAITAERAKVFVSEKGTNPKPEFPATPDEIWGKLFTDVQLQMVLGDNKTFVDAVPKFSPQAILKRYNDAQKTQDSSFHLKDFVFQNFKVPVAANVKLPEKTTSLKKHLEELWPTLTRKADVIENILRCCLYQRPMSCRADVSEKSIIGTATLLCRDLLSVTVMILLKICSIILNT